MRYRGREEKSVHMSESIENGYVVQLRTLSAVRYFKATGVIPVITQIL